MKNQAADVENGVHPKADDAVSGSSGSEQTVQDGTFQEVKLQNSLDPFGNEEGADVKYKTMTWFQGSLVMVAENISLGILSLPAVVAKVGLIGGITSIFLLGLLSTYSGYVLWQFRMRHPHITNYADVGGILLGRVGREIFGAAYVIYMVFCMASHILTFTIAMNVLTEHAACTIVWGVIGLVVFCLLSIPRTLKGISWLAIASFISIVSAVLITMIALGIKPQATASMMRATYNPTFPSAFNSISNIVFAYAGHVAWISFISELREPKDFPKALLLQQSVDIILYLVSAIVIYRYGGEHVTSPALSSNTIVIKKVAWGIAIPTIIIAGVIFAHVTMKYVFIRLFAGTRHLHSRGWKATSAWIGLGVLTWVVAWIIAESIPNFSDLLGFISALFASWFSYGVPGVCWFYMQYEGNWKIWIRGGKNIWLSSINLILVIVGAIICVAGLDASSYQMHLDTSGSVWSCANNAE